MIVSMIDYLRDRLKYVNRICYVLLAFTAVTGSLITWGNHHAHTQIEQYPFFWSAFGFFSCTIIIIVSKWFGHSGVMVKEEFYDE